MTPSNQAEQELLHAKPDVAQQATDKYRMLYNAIDEGFSIIEVLYGDEGKPFDFRYLDANPAFVKHTGIASPVGKTLRDVSLNPDYELINRYAEVVRTGEPVRFTFHMPSTGKWFDVHAARIGKPEDCQVAVLFNDITDRKRAEEALRESETRMQEAFSIETVGVLFFRLDGRITDVNDSFLQMSGYSREELLNMKDWAALTAPEFMDVTSTALKELLEIGKTAPYEKQMIRKDGSRWWGLFAPTRLSGEGLKAECVEMIIDIAERKQTETALRQHQATLQSFYDSAPFLMGIAELDGNQIIAVSGNRAAAEFFATDPLALPGKTGIELGNAEGFEQLWIEKYRRSQRDSKPVRFDYEHPRQGASRWLHATVAFIGKGPSGNPWFSFVVEDITGHKRAEHALRERERQLRLLNETLEQKVREKTAEVRRLASDVIKATQRERQRISHVLHDDLQQRIYAIQMQLSFVRDQLKNETEPARKEVSQIERQLADILKMTRDLSIDLSPPILKDEGLSHAIQWLAGRMQKQYGLSIEIQADGAFVIPNEELHVLLFNCVRELLFNVVKHADARRAWVTLEWTEESLQIEVSDDGKGFPVHAPEEQNKGKDNSTPSLGLPTLRHQLSLLGGRMEIHSKSGVGTQVILIVPISEETRP